MANEMQIVEVANVRGYHDERGNVFLNAEDVARGLGFVQQLTTKSMYVGVA